MKNRHLYFSIIITAFVFMLISGCSNVESPDSPEVTATNNVKTLAKDPSEIQQQVVAYMQQNNLHGGYFLDLPPGAGYGLGYVGFENGLPIYQAIFIGSYGTGDFWRQNPDGTISAQLSTNEAYADYFNINTLEDYSDVTAHLNVKFTGTLQEFCFIDPVTGEQICFYFLPADPDINAFILNGHATVTLNGSGEDPHTLDMRVVANPGGQNQFVLTFN